MKITIIIFLSVISFPLVNAQQVVKSTLHSSTNTQTALIRQTIGQPIAPKTQSSFLYGYQAPLLVRIEKDLAPEIAVYPNPVSEALQIYVPEQGYLYLISAVSGQLIERGSLKETRNSLSVQDIPNGVFIFTLYDPKNKLIKQLKIIKR